MHDLLNNLCANDVVPYDNELGPNGLVQRFEQIISAVFIPYYHPHPMLNGCFMQFFLKVVQLSYLSLRSEV